MNRPPPHTLVPPLLVEQAAQPLDLDSAYRRHSATVARWAMRLGGRELDFEDIVHDVFLKLQKALPGFSSEEKLTRWLFKVTLNEVRYRRRTLRLRRFLAGLAPDFAQEVPSGEPLAPERMERSEADRRVHLALERLPEKFRVALVLFELEGRSGQEVAALMGAKVETLWVWLGRARARFAAELAKLDAEAER